VEKGLSSSRRHDLGPGTVLVIVLEHEPAWEDERLLGLLDWSPEDRDRMAAFRHQGAKTSWCLSRRLLRDALCELVGVEDAHERMEYGEYGKPFIKDCRLQFNWSHAGGCVALALAEGRSVGVDIESFDRPSVGYLDIADAYFNEQERAWVKAATGEESSWARFLSLFVQKEAWLKATGLGLSSPLADARAELILPPKRNPISALLEVGRNARYFLAVDASIGGRSEDLDFIIENCWDKID
jgi:4'-phosphopantetheinyl transferase